MECRVVFEKFVSYELFENLFTSFLESGFLQSQILFLDCGKYHWLITLAKTDGCVISLIPVLHLIQPKKPSNCLIPISSDTIQPTELRFSCFWRKNGWLITLSLKVRSLENLKFSHLPSTNKKTKRILSLWPEKLKLHRVIKLSLSSLRKPTNTTMPMTFSI